MRLDLLEVDSTQSNLLLKNYLWVLVVFPSLSIRIVHYLSFHRILSDRVEDHQDHLLPPSVKPHQITT